MKKYLLLLLPLFFIGCLDFRPPSQRFSTIYGTPAEHIVKAIENNEELLSFWEDMSNREDLQLLFKQTRNLSSNAIKNVVQFMKAVEDEHRQNSDF